MTIRPGIDMIAVEWVDAFWDDSHFDLDNLRQTDLLLCTTVGYLADENESRLLIAGEWQSRLNRYKHLVGIPKVNIIRQHRWKLRWPHHTPTPKSA